MPTLAEATLVNLDIEPGWQMMADHVALGKRYIIDLDQVSALVMLNTLTDQEKLVACVWVVAPEPGGWLPVVAFGMKATIVERGN